MHRFAAVFALAAVSAAPPPSVDAHLRAMVAPVSEARLRHTIETLVGLGTRHTLSSQTDPKRGIGAALNWAHDEFERYSADCGNCLELAKPGQQFTGSRIPNPTWVYDMVAIQRGTERPNDVVIITGHIDSRVTDVMNATDDAPGANDDGSGSAAVMESARVLSKHKFPGTIVYALVSGEEQGLYGSKVLADYAKAQGWNVVTDINNDIVGGTCGSDGVCDSTHARVLSEGPRSQGQAELADATHSLGGENDAPSRNISRFLDSLADRLEIGLDVRQIWRTDRFGRGGDHIPFLDLGYPAARLSVAVENYNWQHQDLRTESEICVDCAGPSPRPVAYGDTIDHVDFPYLAKMTKLDAAALAAIASAPPPPAPKVEGAVSTDTTLSWEPVSGAASYVVRWRRTDSNQWTQSKAAPGTATGLVLPHIRVDDWVFGVSSVSATGFESPVASAVPGGAFRPYVAKPKK